jgi:hypothetical protein
MKPGVGVEREALDEGTAAAGPAGPRRPGGWNLDALELEELEGLLGGDPLLEDAACAKGGEDAASDGGGHLLHVAVGRRRKRNEPGGAFAHLLEDGLGKKDVEVRGELERRAEALDEGHRPAACPGHAPPPRRSTLEGEERISEASVLASSA